MYEDPKQKVGKTGIWMECRWSYWRNLLLLPGMVHPWWPERCKFQDLGCWGGYGMTGDDMRTNEGEELYQDVEILEITSNTSIRYDIYLSPQERSLCLRLFVVIVYLMRLDDERCCAWSIFWLLSALTNGKN